MRNHLRLGFVGFGILFGLLLAGLFSSPLSAQVIKGSISANVVDQTGAVVPGAQVTVRSKETGAEAATVTNSTGAFKVSLLAIGTYDLEVSKTGFQKLAVSSVEVSAAQDNGLGTLQLKLGQVTTTVEVAGTPLLLQSTQSQISTSVKGEIMNHFPGIMSNQGIDNLALQLPGVSDVRDQGFSNSNGTNGFSVNGLRGRNNDQQIDGQNNNDNSVGGPYFFLSNIDFVEEYQITTNNFGPEYGRNAGSVVNIITKSGTNSWHGTVFGTESNSRLNSLSNNEKVFTKLKKPPRFNDEFSGGSIGGPIIKDKAFLFGGFDNEILSRTRVFSAGSRTPTPAGLGQLAGCFPGSNSVAALQQFGPYGIGGGNPKISGTPTNVTLTNPVTGVKCPVEMAGVQRTLPSPFHEWDAIVKIDTTGDRDHISGRWLVQWANSINTDAFGTGAAGYPANVPAFSQDFGISWVHNVSNSMVNEVRFSYGRLFVEFGGNTIGNTIPGQANIDQALARITMPAGFLGFGPATNAPQGRIVNTYQTQDNWSYIRGRHQFKAGFNWTFQRSPNAFLPTVNGNFAFTNFSNFAANRPGTVSVALGNPKLDLRENDIFLYFGDDFKLKPNLTLNLGVTWSLFTQPSNLFNRLTTERESNAATAFFNPALPLSIRTSPFTPKRKDTLGPSIGFAYTPQWGGWLTGHGKTVLRGGYRIAYDPPFYNIYLNMSTSTPNVLLQTLTGANATNNPLLAQPFGPAVRTQLAPFLTLGVFDPRSFNQTNITPDFGRDKVQSWSFGIQRELTPHLAYEVRYVGNHGQDLFQSINGNPKISALAAEFPTLLPSGLTPCAAADAVVSRAIGRVRCDVGVLRTRTNTGVSDYNALQMELRGRRVFNQLDIRSAYTWSKTTDNVSEIFSTFAGGNSLAISQNPLDFRGAEHGLSGLDFRHKWTLSFYEELPVFRSQQGLFGRLLGGWAISGSYQLASGQTYTPVQFCLHFCAGGDVFDTTFNRAFFGVFETARPFVSNANAPVSNVGIFAGDLCNFNGGTDECALPSNTLVSFNAFNASGAVTTVTNGDVRFIINAPQANTAFGTPFGSAGRNILRDAITNRANFALFKDTRFGERVRMRWWTEFANVFNHPNFSSVDPFLDDAGLTDEATGFGVPRLTDGGIRTIRFGLKFLF